MAQLDRLISVMVSNRAECLVLDENDIARILVAGDSRPLTKAPLSAGQIVGLLREIAPPDANASIAAGQGTTFRYDSAEGSFGVKVRSEGGVWKCQIKVDDHGEFQRMTGSFKAVDGVPVRSATPLTTAAVARVGGPLSAEQARAEIESLLRLMVQRGGSDLHLRVEEPPILRLHGEMIRVDGRPPLEANVLEALLVSIMPQRNRDEFAACNDTDFAYEIEGVARFRANALRDRKGPAAVFRTIPANVVTVEQLGISEDVQRLCYLTKGLVLVTGPTGSGKSTTLCSLIDLVNRARHDHVITIEDPIEFVHQNKNCIITQRQVGVHTDSFKNALRAALREDPDVILVGELRDLETTAIAIETAETGHLVFGTLHTTTAASTVDRIIDQFPADRQGQIRTMLSESLKGVISQTLLKKIGGGRVAAQEILLSNHAMSNLIREGKTFQIPSMMQTSRKYGMVTLNDALIGLVDDGKVEPKEAYVKSVDKAGFEQLLKNNGHDTSFLEGDVMGGGDKGAKGGKLETPAKPAMARR